MQLSREDFDNPEVAGAVNPHPDYGYFHDATSQSMATKYVASPSILRLLALKQWILSRGWRTARYVKEPGEGPMYSIIQDYCNFLKQLAQEDNNFAQQFGTEFHRPVYDPGIYSTYSLRMLIFPRGWHKSSPLPSKPPTPLSAPKRKRAPPKKGHKATGSRKQPARAKKDAAESVPETA
ncbi:uncharacterized protein ATNIH1004_011502 [Aspergillus tanneri]|uniref:Uncharacterized protein n=1 Tax=Aspergillus tanneri TaxID=1220188 RepID=A0A5M9MI11_9EURO|nr:uncharacterized protein ATNIH1004_011502 [Aspergillus tanneri]KAA8642557.1 hypothetical protein ATNIH1004_011502 [Aspergillus tanneri]